MKSITSAYAEFKNLELDKFKTTYKTCEVLRQEYLKVLRTLDFIL